MCAISNALLSRSKAETRPKEGEREGERKGGRERGKEGSRRTIDEQDLLHLPVLALPRFLLQALLAKGGLEQTGLRLGEREGIDEDELAWGRKGEGEGGREGGRKMEWKNEERDSRSKILNEGGREGGKEGGRKTSLPSRALADSAILTPSALTFLFNLKEKSRCTGPCAFIPPRN